MNRALKHAKSRAKSLSRCNITYIIHISLKELGITSSNDGFHYAKQAIHILCDNQTMKLTKGVYSAVGMSKDPWTGEDQVEQAIRNVIQYAWRNRNESIWECYFPVGAAGRSKCPSNRDFLMAVVDFVELWKAFCEEVNYGK